MINQKSLNPYAEVPLEKWNDWKWQLKNRLTSVDDVIRVLHPSEKIIEGIKVATKHFRMSITPYYAGLIDINASFIRRATSGSSKDSCSMTWHQWQVE